jgi:pyridoxal phosphate enzyme (YggS family)
MIKYHYDDVIQQIRDHSKQVNEPVLIAVSKTKPIEVIREAIQSGIVHFGENQIQEGISKFTELRAEFPHHTILLHHLGPVQSGTLRKLFGVFQFTHGVGTHSALKELVKRSLKETQCIRYFLQVNLTGEDTKNGFSLDEIKEIINHKQEFITPQCILEGLMTMGPSDGDRTKTRDVFQKLSDFRKDFAPDLKLSMGMSGDFDLAAEIGTDYLRVGSRIFGERNYA